MKLVLITGLFLSLTSSAFAQFFPAAASITTFPGQVTAQVYNPYYEPIICSGQVFGQTARGFVLSTYLHEQFMPAGHYRYVFVTTGPYNPFVGGWGNFHCRFAWW